MRISQLEAIINVAEFGSISKAAASMQVAQPAVSRMVRSLEQELAVALFVRHGRGMTPTEAGAGYGQ